MPITYNDKVATSHKFVMVPQNADTAPYVAEQFNTILKDHGYSKPIITAQHVSHATSDPYGKVPIVCCGPSVLCMVYQPNLHNYLLTIRNSDNSSLAQALIIVCVHECGDRWTVITDKIYHASEVVSLLNRIDKTNKRGGLNTI